MIRVTVWNEFYHEKEMEDVKAIYPNGIHGCIADFLGKEDDITVKTATLDEPECGLSQDVLDNTDVLIWWGHMLHKNVPDEVAYRVVKAVNNGMGIIFLHSAHHSKPFRYLLGTPCHLTWREDGDSERLWVSSLGHPITKGIDRFFDLPNEETYGEPFVIPTPDEVVFIGWYSGGDVFRSGVTYHRGLGKIFYFQPGHESFPTFHDKNVQTVIKNAVRWAVPVDRQELTCPHVTKV